MQFNTINSTKIYFLLIAITLMSSCVSVKNYQPNKPFVFENKIIIKNNINKDQKKKLINELNNYWDDSMQVKKVVSLGVFSTIKNPPIYDSGNFIRSISFMDNYLKSQGFYYASFTKDTTKDIKGDQYRVTPIVTIDLGKNISIDSVAVDLLDSNLQKLAIANFGNTLLKKGTPYTKQIISNELDRHTSLFKRNGYYNFSKDDIYALVDTTDSRFLTLTIDPFELAKLLDEYNNTKKENPKWSVTIKQRQDTFSLASKKYYIGHTNYYTQAGSFDLTDSIIRQPWLHQHTTGNYSLFFDYENIKLTPLKEHSYLLHGEPYNQNLYFKTLNALSKLGPWKQIDAKFIERDNDTLDLHISMIPEKKRGLEVNTELSKNSGDLTAGNLVGISLGATYRNRNVWKQAIQSFTTARIGVEFNPNDSTKALQTFYTTFGHTYSFPRIIGNNPIKSLASLIPIKILRRNILDILNIEDRRTLFSLNASYSDRFDLFKLKSFTGSFGYEFKELDNVWAYKPLNVELYSLDKLKGLDDLIKNNPFLVLSFNTGNVIGQSFSFTKSKINPLKPNHSFLFRVGIEESGLVAGMFKTLENTVYRYVKLEVEYRKSIKQEKTELAYKLFGGLGINYSSSNDIGNVLPFFKQFFAGGPNSMRAWGLRQLGQGSSLLYDTSTSSFKDRFGDVRVEGNFEYRFLIYNGSFLKVGSTLFADIGNVWNLKKDINNPNSEFTFKNFLRDVAVDMGTGLRLDFGGYFMLRLDVAYKIKDPGRQYNNGWVDLSNASFKENRMNGVEVRNVAFQLGIGLPF
jgi:outer membrane protein insertion porin family